MITHLHAKGFVEARVGDNVSICLIQKRAFRSQNKAVHLLKQNPKSNMIK